MLTDPPLYNKSHNGQKFFFNQSSKVVILELREIFNHAGKIFQWDEKYGMTAFGINQNIIQFVLGTKSKLLIHYYSNDTKKEYWINHDVIKNFVTKNNNKKTLRGTNIILNNIPLSLFVSKPVFSGRDCIGSNGQIKT